MGGELPFVEALGPRAVPFLPCHVPGLQIWLEADSGVEHTAGRISAWRDRSGRGNHPVQALGAAQPLYTTANGRPVVQADDNARFLAIPKGSADLEPGSGATVYCVVSTSVTASVYGVWGLWGSVPAGNVWCQTINDGANGSASFYMSETGTNLNRLATIAADPSTGNPVLLTHRWDGSNIRGAVSATTGGPTACAGAKAASGTTGNFTILRYYDATANPAGVLSISALLKYGRHIARDSAEDVRVRNYLRRWGAT